MGDSHAGHLISGMSKLQDRTYNLEYYSISCKVPYYKFKSAIGALNHPVSSTVSSLFLQGRPDMNHS